MRSVLLRGWLPSLVLVVSASACYHPPVKQQSGAKADAPPARLTQLKRFRFAFETTDKTCRLEAADANGKEPGLPAKGWGGFEIGGHLGESFETLQLARVGKRGVALRVKDQDGKEYWLRNTKDSIDSEASTLEAWRCAVDEEWIQAQKVELKARYVQLDLSGERCPSLAPILGGRSDITLSPYTVLDAGLYVGRRPGDEALLAGKVGALAVGLKLAAEGGDRQLTVPLTVFNQCFTAAHRSPPLPAEAEALRSWLDGSSPDTTPPPKLSIDTVEASLGINRSLCLKEALKSGEHLECRQPILRITPGSDGPFGPSHLLLTRERQVDAFHFLKGKLVGPSEVVRVDALARLEGAGAGSAFGRTFQTLLDASTRDEAKVMQRAARGFRLRAGAQGGSATHVVDLLLDYKVPDLETSTERRSHTYVAGKKRVHNDGFDKATQELEQAKNDVESAQKELEHAEQTAKEVKAASDVACKKLAEKGSSFIPIPGLDLVAGAAGKASCSAAIDAVAVGKSAERLKAARERLQKATVTLADTPRETEVDDQRSFEYEAKTYRRRGSATARVGVRPLQGGGSSPFTAAFEVPFDASDVEIPDDPARHLVGKAASPPSVEAAEQALAAALVPLVDAAIIRWGEQRQVGGDVGELRPGTRSWGVAVARHAAADRNVKLLSDLLEDRADELAKPRLSYPVRVTEEMARRCYTFSAVALDGGVDVNLALAIPREGGASAILARDARRDPDAAIEVCNLAAGEYAVEVSFGTDNHGKGGVLVSMFDATPGAATAQDTQAATRGLPTRPRQGEVMALASSGVVQFRGSSGEMIQGRTGDRDGDGVADEADRCPYDPETVNGYLDEDGCPDEVPPGFAPPASAAKPSGDGGSSAPKAPALPLEQEADAALSAGDHAGALLKLKKAMAACVSAQCSDGVMARLLLKQGIALSRDPNRGAEATAKFVSALQLDPKVAPEGAQLSPTVKKLWASARLKKGMSR